MINIKKIFPNLSLAIRWGFLFFATFVTGNVYGDTVTMALNAPTIFSDSVIPSKTSSVIKIPISGIESMQLEIVAPVNGATFMLLDPSGRVALENADSGVSTLDGPTQTPPLPGVMFLTPAINTPEDGVWSLQVDFPSASEKTVIMATLFTETKYQAGIVLERNEFRVGQLASIGMIILNNGQPILGLNPKMKITPPTGTPIIINGIDDGSYTNFDGLVDDGIYSGGYTFSEVGTYTIEGSVDIQTANGILKRTASAIVTATNPVVKLTNFNGNIVSDPSGCIAGLNLHIDADGQMPATFVSSAKLNGSNGKFIESTSSYELLSAGAISFDLFYSSDDIRNSLGVDGPYIINPLDIISFLTDSVNQEIRVPDAFTFSSVRLSDLCISPIVISNNLNVSQTLRSGFIDSLQFSFPITVAKGGAYQVSFKVTDSAGQDVDSFGFSKSMSLGSNAVNVSIPYKMFQSKDGPYSVESVLVVGQSVSAQASVVGSSSALKRWQFFPNITGDLDSDGDVDVNDRDLLLSFRGQRALISGDRRDLYKDGRIDIRDAGSILSKACKVGFCVAN